MKNHAIVNLVFCKPVVFLFAALVVVSCKKDDDDNPAPPVESQDVSFKVELIKMTALEISDAEGDALEVYGSVGANLVRDNITEENELWSAIDEEYISVELSDYPMSSSVTFTVAPEHISGSSIEVISSLNEHDFSEDNPDEDLGTETVTTPLSAVSSTSTFQMVLDDYSQQQVQVTYSITRL